MAKPIARMRQRRERAGAPPRVAAVLLALGVAAAMAVMSTAPVGGAAATVSSERIAGPTRYDTAALSAEAWAAERSRAGRDVTTVLLASGADAHAAAALVTPALSRAYDAPVLLTHPEGLSHATAAFLTRHPVERVIIVGRAEAVAPTVEADLKALGLDGFRRLSGDDQYETAVAVATHLQDAFGSPGTFGSRGATAVVTSGENTADALAIGPFAYHGEHPVLLTQSRMLPSVVAEHLRSSGIVHAVIVGGTAAVSEGVESSLNALGISTERWHGPDRYATAARIATELLGDGSQVPCFDGTDAGIAVGTRSPDAITSAPLLGERCAPLLLVASERVPAVVRRTLAGAGRFAGGLRGRLNIVVFGGASAVSASTKDDVERAATLVPIEAHIRALAGRCHFSVQFDEPVSITDASDPGSYQVDASSLSDGSVVVDAADGPVTRSVMVVLAGGATVVGGAAPVGCDSPLQSGSSVQVSGGVIAGADGRRAVGVTSRTVAGDTAEPRLTLTAPINSRSIWVDADEPVREVLGLVEFYRKNEDPETRLVQGEILEGSLGFEVEVPPELGILRQGDRVTVIANAVRDLNNNRSRSVAASVSSRSDTRPPRVSSVRLASPLVTESATAAADGLGGRLVVTALPGGDAAGAEGNDWRLAVESVDSWSASRYIDVEVSFRSQLIRLRVPSSRPMRSVVADLHSDTTFSAHFGAALAGGTWDGDGVFDLDVGPVSFSGGQSAVDIKVYWSEPVIDCDGGFDAVDPRQLELDIDADGIGEYSLDGTFASRYDVRVTALGHAAAPSYPLGAACVYESGVATGTLAARLVSENASSLPTNRSHLIAYADAATDRALNRSEKRVITGFGRD